MSFVFGLMLFVLVAAYAFGVHWSSKSAEVVRKTAHAMLMKTLNFN